MRADDINLAYNETNALVDLTDPGNSRLVTKVRGGGPSSNLIVGTCRFGDDPKTTVLDRNCKAHDVANLYVTDGSFMPSGGAVPYTFTIYANALRVAEVLQKRLG